MRREKVDLTGQRFGRLVVLEMKSNPNPKNKHILAICKCDCGTIKTIRARCLLEGQESCGCKAKEDRAKINTKHGDFGTRLYRTWNGMLNRTKRKSPKEKERYWGRGISVCKEWESYPKFKEWALSHGYRDDLTIDRIDVNGNYCPENCRWATRTEQQNNRCNTRWIEYKGQVKSLKDWCRELKLNENSVASRYNLGWQSPYIFETPFAVNNQKRV